MTAKNKGSLLTAFSIAMILSVIIAMPTKVGATAIGGPFEFDVYGNGLALVSVSITEVGSAGDYDYRYDYFVDVSAPLSLFQMSIGFVDVDTLELYVVKAAEFSVPPASAPASRQTDNSLLLYFLPSGLGVGVDFPDAGKGEALSVIFDNLIEDQYISVRTLGTGGGTKTVTARYEIDGQNETPIPEPTTLLLLACGVLGLGFLSRKRGK